MLRLWGAGLILAAPICFSLSRWMARQQQDKLLAAYIQTLELCAGQILCDLTPLPELAVLLARQGPEALRGFWQTLREGLSQTDYSAESLWRAALAGTSLSAAAREILAPVPQALRSYDTDQIVRELGRIRMELTQYRARMSETFRRDFRLHAGVQVSAALLLLILLF